MYKVYLDGTLFPIAPGRIEITAENDNREIELIDGSFVTRTGRRGLRKVAFELMLPMSKYPFALYEDGFKDGMQYVDKLNTIAIKNYPVWLDIYRAKRENHITYLTSIMVVIKRMTIIEDAENGLDMTVRVELMEYRNVQTKIATEKLKKNYVKRDSDLDIPETYTVKEGDSLWLISKRFFDDSTKYTYLANINSIEPPYTIYRGQVIKLRG